jgi:hypothetical protein
MFDDLKTKHSPAVKPLRVKLPAELFFRVLHEAQSELQSLDEFVCELLEKRLSAGRAVRESERAA